MDELKILVTGGRNFHNTMMVVNELNKIVDDHPGRAVVLIHGGAYGADKAASGWAKSRGIKCIECKADWATYGKLAGPIRNSLMVKMSPDICIAFPGGRGTNDCAKKAKEAGIRLIDLR